MFDFIKLVSSFFPLHIKDVHWDGDSLIISGDKWSFATNSVWRISNNKELLFTCWDDDADRLIKDLAGLLIIDFSWISNDQPIDPSITFSGGKRLDVFCSCSHEPWLLNLPNGSVYAGNS